MPRIVTDLPPSYLLIVLGLIGPRRAFFSSFILKCQKLNCIIWNDCCDLLFLIWVFETLDPILGLVEWAPRTCVVIASTSDCGERGGVLLPSCSSVVPSVVMLCACSCNPNPKGECKMFSNLTHKNRSFSGLSEYLDIRGHMLKRNKSHCPGLLRLPSDLQHRAQNCSIL